MVKIERILVTLAVLTICLSGIAAKGRHHLTEEWTDRDYEPRSSHKILVIGIAHLTEERKHFENKFLSHLRTRKYDGVTSHTIAPHLDQIEDRKAIVRALRGMGVDGAITVRLVPLKDRTEEEWAGAWQRWVNSAPRVRELIEATLPDAGEKTKRYGIEVAFWESNDWNLVWAARTDIYKRKELSDAAGTFVEFAMAALWDAGLVQ